MPHLLRVISRFFHFQLRKQYWRTPLPHRRHRTAQLDILSGLLAPGMTAIDVGADVGLYTLEFARVVGPTGQVWAYEPHPSSFAILRNTISAWGVHWVDVSPVALGANLHIASLNTPLGRRGIPYAPLSHITCQEDGVEVGATQVNRVSVQSLDDHLPFTRRIDLIKVDVEGYELEVLQGAERLLQVHAPNIFVEIEQQHHDRYKRSASLVFELLTSYGYAPHAGNEDAFDPGNYLFVPH